MLNVSHEVMQDIQPGETLRVNHEHCPAGEDTRRRLYLTRPLADPAKIAWYCHNCSEGGYKHTVRYETYRNQRHEATNSIVLDNTDELTEPPGLIEKLFDWPEEAITWAGENTLSNAVLNKYGIKYDPSTNRVYLPRYNTSGDLDGYQLRRLFGRGPKYITVSKQDSKGWSMFPTGNFRDTVVIVEDLVSAIKVREACAPIAVVVMHGIQTNLDALHSASFYANGVVWLDNDSFWVKKQANVMKRTLELIANKPAYIVRKKTDPKHYSYAVIEQTIREAING